MSLGTESVEQHTGTGPDRLPPQDLAAERSVLGAMLISPDAIADVVESLRGNDFYRPAHELIFDAITDLYAKGEPADLVTVTAELTRRGHLARIGNAGYLHDLANEVPTATSAGYYSRIVQERATLRRLVSAGTRIAQLGYATDGGDVEELVNTAQAEMHAVTERRATQDYESLSDLLAPVLDEVDKTQQSDNQVTGVPTGFRELDDLTGGLHAGQMIVVAARPAIGKSTLGVDIARNAAVKAKQTAAVFSLEMSKSEITKRVLSAEAQVNLSKLTKGGMGQDDWMKIARVQDKVASAPLFIDDSPNLTLMEIRAKARRLKQQHDLRIMVIDYLQLMTSGKRVESRQQEVSEFSRALKLLAKELEIPVIAISQLNRGAEQRQGNRPQMSDLRESGAIEQDADIVILLHRDEAYDRESPRPGEADLIVAKHRNGQTADIVLAFRGKYASFKDMPQM